MGIGGFVRGRREALGWSRGELAVRAGVSKGLIQKLEQGTRAPTSGALGVLFDVLDVPGAYREYAGAVLQPELALGVGAGVGPQWRSWLCWRGCRFRPVIRRRRGSM
ncbi:helix-turn-helix domain-containing protein [Nocardia crassostreae]|uniref:helix-turn-helix domain-containing protein n=1 Tax=Nocardia crassostreae TaxID=53428 RepID=UPI0012FBE335